MTITKFRHSCFLMEENGIRILFDPGTFSKGYQDLADLDCILITHEHQDHLDVDAVKHIVSKNPGIEIYTNASVQKILEKEGIESSILTHGESDVVKGISIEAIGEDHAVMVSGVAPAENVGFLVAGRIFYPGDALTIPSKPIEILALPAAAPWSKMSETIDYALAIKPKYAFPVHEAILAMPQMMYGMMGTILKEHDIEFRPLDPDGETQF